MIESFDGPHRFLSNFWPAGVVLEGLWCPTVEHAYQAAKTLDMAKRQEIAELHSSRAGTAKKLGRTVEIRPGWDSMKEQVMLELLRQKFQHEELKGLLLATGDEELVEGNTWGDTFWGVCRGIGQNRLGLLLMKVREELKEVE